MIRNCLVLVFSLISLLVQAQDFNIVAFGAKSDSIKLNTKAIQAAIDAAAVNCGRVVIPAGVFMSGTIYLKSNVTLYLSRGSVIKGSQFIENYPENKPSFSGAQTHRAHWKAMPSKALIYADNVENIAIMGEGTINGNGDSKEYNTFDDNPNRPKVIMFVKCRNVKVENVTLTNSAFWLQHYFACDGVQIRGINVYNHGNHNNDGIDIDSKNVTMSDCIINSNDDAICLKSDSRLLCENVVISNCVISSNCNAIKFGTASYGGFRNVTITNCVVKKTGSVKTQRGELKDGQNDNIRGLAGIALEIVDGGSMENINVNNIIINDVLTPIFIKLGSRMNPTGSIKNVIISNIIASTKSLCANSISGVPGFNVENVVLKDIICNIYGGGTLSDANITLPENEKGYPECRMWGYVLPAYGLYLRHVKDITLENVQFNLQTNDSRPAIYMEDAERVQIRNSKFSIPQGKQALIRLKDVTSLSLSNIYSNTDIPFLLNVSGAKTTQIKVDKKYDKQSIVVSPEVNKQNL